MADLNVQPKRRAPVWPWIILLLIVAAVAYFVLRDNDVVTDGTDTDTTVTQPVDTGNLYRSDTARTDTVPMR